MPEIALYTNSVIDRTLTESAADWVRAGVSANTRRAYSSDRTNYLNWCEQTNRTSIPATAETLAEYAAWMADTGYAPKSIDRAIGAVCAMHEHQGHVIPSRRAARMVLRGLKRRRAARGITEAKAAGFELDDLRRLVATCDTQSAAGIRDRAVLLLGFALMARRSELCDLNCEDVREHASGMEVTLRWSKVDQDARGIVMAVPFGAHPETCPVRAVLGWLGLLSARRIETGPLFRSVDQCGRTPGELGYGGRAKGGRMSGQAVTLIIRRAAQKAGLEVANLSAHSLRRSGATTAFRNGVNILDIARTGRWIEGSAALYGYIQPVERWQEPAIGKLGL